MIERVKEMFGIYGGELGEKMEKLKLLEKNKLPKEIEKARKKYDELTHDLPYRSDCLTMREKELLEKELPEITAKLSNYYEAEPMRLKAIQDLKQEINLIEKQILYWKNRRKNLSEKEKPVIEENLNKQKRTLEATHQAIKQAHAEILNNMEKLDVEISELNEKKKTAEIEERIKIDTRLRVLESAKTKNLLEIIPEKQNFIEDKMKTKKKLEITIKNIEDNLKDALQECDDQLIRLWGKTN